MTGIRDYRERIELCEKYKKRIYDNIGDIENPDEWLKYYNGFIDYCESEIKRKKVITVIPFFIIGLLVMFYINFESELTGLVPYEENATIENITETNVTQINITNVTEFENISEMQNISDDAQKYSENITEVNITELEFNITENVTVENITEIVNITLPEININLEYKSNTLFDADDNGIANLTDIVDFTVENTLFNFDVNYSKLCTRYGIESLDNLTKSFVCYGNTNCCNFVELIPILDDWNDPLNVYVKRYDAGLYNIISAQVLFYNITDIYYSEWQNLTAKFMEEVNVTVPVNITNITKAVNITIINETIKQFGAVIGKPVKWQKRVKYSNLTLANITIPKSAINFSVKKIVDGKEIKVNESKIKIKKDNIIKTVDEFELDKITGYTVRISEGTGLLSRLLNWMFDKFNTVTGYVTGTPEKKDEAEIIIEEEVEELVVEYYTDAPVAVEEITVSGKKITVSAYLNYTDILTYTSITDIPESAIRLYWYASEEDYKKYIDENYSIKGVGKIKVDITYEGYFGISFLDENNNGLIDQVYWITPHTSEQEFEISITILTVHSNPFVGKNWTIEFNTTGMANLTITPVEGTTFLDEDDITSDHLEFLDLKCFDESVSVTKIYNGSTFESVFVENWNCPYGVLTNKWLIREAHKIEFKFGNLNEYAYNAPDSEAPENYTFKIWEGSYNSIDTLIEDWTLGCDTDPSDDNEDGDQGYTCDKAVGTAANPTYCSLVGDVFVGFRVADEYEGAPYGYFYVTCANQNTCEGESALNDDPVNGLFLYNCDVPYWKENKTNFTLIRANEAGAFSINYTDISNGLDTIIFSRLESGGSWTNETTQRVSGTSANITFNYTVTSTSTQTFQWKFYGNDTAGFWNESIVHSIVISDTYPTWSNNGTNFTSIKTNQNGMFNITVNDADGLDRCIFSLKNSSSDSWYNYSALDVSGTSYDLRYNITISSTSNQILSWRYYCNDSIGVMYNSSIYNITISNTVPSAPTNINWITKGELTSSSLSYRQTLDEINATCNNESDMDLIGCNITVKRPDNSIEVNNKPMSQSNALYNYSENIKLTSSGTWTIEVTSYDSLDQATSTSTITVSITTPTIVDGLYGYDTNTLINENEIIADYNYGYDTIGYKINWSEVGNNWSDVKNIINQTYDIINAKSFLKFYFNGSYDPTNLYTNTTCNEIHTYLTDIKNYPYDDEVLFFVIELNKSRPYTVNFTNKISECIVNVTNNRYPVYVYNYSNSSLDTDYVTNWTMIRYTTSSNQTLLDNELKYLRTDTSLTRIYYNLLTEVKAKAQDFHDKIITDLRDNIRLTSFSNVKLAETVNNDVIVINNETSEKLINATNITGRDGKDIWDIVNDRLIEKNTDGNFTLNLSSLSYTILFFDDLDHLTTSYVYKGSVPVEKERQYNRSSDAPGAQSIVGDYDAKFIIWDTSYDHSNHFMIHYAWINSSAVTNYSDYCDNGDGVVIIADKNPVEINGSINCNNASYGYISVAGYEDTDAWENSKKNEIDQWIDDHKINVFVDGLDYGASESGFETRMKSLGDYIREEKNKKVIFNDYTSYKTVSEYGTMDMKESFCGRWGGDVDNPTYTWETFSVDFDRAKWAKTNNKKQLLMTFGDENNVSKISYCYAMYLVFFGPTNLWKYAQPNFQNQREQFTINAGNVLQNSWTEVNSTYYTRRYSNGIVWVDTTNHNWGINNGRNINKVELHLLLQHYAVDPSAASGLNISVNDGQPYIIEPLDICATQWCGKTVVINITNDFTDNGRYLVRVYPNDRSNANGINLWNQAANRTGVYSWWENSANNYPTAEPSWTAYGRSGNQLDTDTTNWIISLLINDSTSASIDTLTGINQYNKTEKGITNITLNSTIDYNMTVWGDFFSIPLSEGKHTFKYLNDTDWVKITPLWTSTCNSTEPSWNTITINGLTHKTCYYSDGFRFVTPQLSEQIYSLESSYTTWSKDGTNFTSIKYGENGMFNVTVSDADGLDSAIFSLKNSSSGSWYNYSALRISGTSYELRYNITISSTNTQTLSWRYYVNDSDGIMYNSSVNNILISDTQLTFSQNGTNTTSYYINDNVLFNITATDVDELASYIFSMKNSSSDSWYNYSAVDISGNTSYFINTTHSISSTNGQTLSWRYYVNDSGGVMNDSGIHQFSINDTYMTWTRDGTNFTSIQINENGMFNVTVNEPDGLDRCIFSLKNSTTKDWYNYSALDVSGTNYELIYNITISSGNTLSWRYYCNDSAGVMYNSSIYNVDTDFTSPYFSNNRTNFTSIRSNENGQFNITAEDRDTLDTIIFSRLESGDVWTNETTQRISGNLYDIAFNYTVTTTGTFQWKFYLNDSSGNWNESTVWNVDVAFSGTSNSTITNSTTSNSTIYDSTLTNSSVTSSTINQSTLTNSTVTNSTVTESTIEDSTLTNTTVVGSTVNQSTLTNSTVTNSTVTESTIEDSTLTNTSATNSTIVESTIEDSTLTNTSVTNSTVTESTINDSTITNSTITDSTINQSVITNSTVTNSTIVDMVITDANLTNFNGTNGTITGTGIPDTVTAVNVNITNGCIYAGTAIYLGIAFTSGCFPEILVAPPFFSNNKTNFSSIRVNENAQFWILVNDSLKNIDYVTFSFKNSSSASWENITTSFEEMWITRGINATFRLTISSVYNDVFEWRFYANDSDGYMNESQIYNITISDTAPALPSWLGPINDSSFNVNTTFNWTATDADNNVLYYYMYLGQSNPPDTPVVNNLTDSNWTSNFTSEGVYYYRVLASDLTLNSSFTEIRTINYDLTNPGVSLITQNNSDVSDPTPTISFNVTDNLASVLDYTIHINGSGVDSRGEVSNGTALNVDLSTQLSLGTHKIIIEITDQAGNKINSSELFVSVTSSIVYLNYPDDNEYLNYQTVNFTFNVTDASYPTLNCSLYIDNVYNQSDASTPINTKTQFFVTLAEGNYTWNVSCRNQEGIEGQDSRAFQIDVTSPDITWVIPKDDGSSIFNDSFSQNVSFNDSSLFQFECIIYSDSALTNAVWALSKNITGPTYTKTDSVSISNLTDATYYERCSVSDRE